MRTRGPDRRRVAGPAPVLVLAALTAGCAGLFGGGGDGLSGWNESLRTALATGRHERALALVGADSARAGDELLRLQHEGLVAHYAGRWEQSSEALERAFAMAEDRYTKSVSRALLSMITSDRVLPYDPPHPERLLLHYYGALNYLRRDEPDEAAVEARRLGHRLQRSLDGEIGETPPALGRALSRFAGAVFEAAGQANDAAVAYRRARAFAERAGKGAVERAEEDSTVARAAADGPVAAADPAAEPPGWQGRDKAAGGGPPDGSGGGEDEARRTGEVLVVVERGFVAHREQRDLTLFLFPDEVRRLRRVRHRTRRDGDDADMDAALEVARRVAGRTFGGSRSFTSHGRRARDRNDDGDPILVRIAWPELRETSRPSGTVRLRVDGDAVAGRPAVRADLSGAVREAYRGRRVLDLAKTLLRAVTKEAVADALEEAVSGEDETLGEVVGWTARIAGALLERADTRSWHLLPATLELHRVRLPAGTHRLEAVLPGGPDAGIGTVEMAPGEVRIVTVRAWR